MTFDEIIALAELYDHGGRFGPREARLAKVIVDNIAETVGLPAGGTQGQVLVKVSAADYDTQWIDSPATGFTPNRVLVSDLLGEIDASLITTAKLNFLADVTSSVQAQLDTLTVTKQATSEKGMPNGYASLDGAGKIPTGQLPSYVDDVLEYADFASLPVTGEQGIIYVTIDNGKTYRWTGSVYIEISPSEVNSVFGRTGVVTAMVGDYTATQILNSPAGDISAMTVQAAINELDAEKVPATRIVTAGAGLTGGGDLSVDRAISMPAVGTPGTYGSASAVGVITTDVQGRVSGATTTPIAITASQVIDFTEAAQDAVGTALADSASIDFIYTDGGNSISADVLPAGVNHNGLLNYVANQHIDHSAVSIIAGAGLSGGGNITASRTLAVVYGTPTTQTPDQTNTAGLNDTTARSDHIHAIPTAIPVSTGTANAQGNAATFARSNHVHNTIVARTEVSTATPFVTSSLTDVVITDFTTTPEAGVYAVFVNVAGQLDSNGRVGTISIYVGAAQQAVTERSVQFNDQTRQRVLATQMVVTVTGSQAVDARVRVSGGTLTVTNRSLMLLRLGS